MSANIKGSSWVLATLLLLVLSGVRLEAKIIDPNLVQDLYREGVNAANLKNDELALKKFKELQIIMEEGKLPENLPPVTSDIML